MICNVQFLESVLVAQRQSQTSKLFKASNLQAVGEPNWWDCYEGPGNCIDQCLSFDTGTAALIEDFPDFFAAVYFNRSVSLRHCTCSVTEA
jgi:hypothetical protein